MKDIGMPSEFEDTQSREEFQHSNSADDGQNDAIDNWSHLLNLTWEDIPDIEALYFADFEENVETSLRGWFEARGIHHCEENWIAIRAIIHTVKIMALGHDTDKTIFVSPLATGIGKTETVCHCIAELIRIGVEHGYWTGILILLPMLRDIKSYIDRIGLTLYSEKFVVRTGSGNEENMWGRGPDPQFERIKSKMGVKSKLKSNTAPICFSSQQMLQTLAGEGVPLLENLKQYRFEDKNRPVIIWDEAMLPAEPRTLRADEVQNLRLPLANAGFTKQRDQIVALAKAMEGKESGSVLSALAKIDLQPTLKHLSTEQVEIAKLIERMVEGKFRTRRDNFHGRVAVFYYDSLPDDFGPCLILDAGAEIRDVYRLWSKGRGRIKFLPSGRKTYGNAKFRHWPIGASKTSLKSAKARTICQGISRLVTTSPETEILVIHPKKLAEHVMRDAISRHMSALGRKVVFNDDEGDEDATRVHFLSWGQHESINDYRDVKHTIIVDFPRYSAAQKEAAFRAAGGRSLTTEYAESEFEQFHTNEMKGALLQAVSRCAIRKVQDGAECGECLVDLIFYDKDSWINQDMVREAFPGASIEYHFPAGQPMREKDLEMIAVLVEVAPEAVGAETRMRHDELAERVGRDARNNKAALKRDDVIERLASFGLRIEGRHGSPLGMAIIRFAEPQPNTNDDKAAAGRDDPIRQKTRRRRRRHRDANKR